MGRAKDSLIDEHDLSWSAKAKIVDSVLHDQAIEFYSADLPESDEDYWRQDSDANAERLAKTFEFQEA